MDELATRAIIIGVSIFVTLVIITVIIIEFDQISNIYAGVAETDISFENQLDELNKFKDENNKFNGLDVRNTYEKYKSYDNIEICVEIGEDTYCDDSKIPNNTNEYKDPYYAQLENNMNVYKIIFIKK